MQSITLSLGMAGLYMSDVIRITIMPAIFRELGILSTESALAVLGCIA